MNNQTGATLSPAFKIPDEERLWITRGAAFHRPLARAAKIGLGNGLGYAVFGGLSLLVELAGFDMTGLLIGAVLLGVGCYERSQAKRLKLAYPDAPLNLARAELTLLAAIVLYGLLGLTTTPETNSALQRELESAKSAGVDLQKIIDSINTIWYTSIIGVALIYQGLMARYFLNRRADVRRYLTEVPQWARDVVESMTG